MSTTSLSSLDSAPVEQEFEGLYRLLDTLKVESKALQTNMKGYSKKYIEIDLSERLLYPKETAKAWFLANNVPIPCELHAFLKILFSKIAKERRMCPRTRTLILSHEEAALFGLQGLYAYKWMEVLRELPAVFT
jgi:hypothetical protein